jgi:hypothetical protein
MAALYQLCREAPLITGQPSKPESYLRSIPKRMRLRCDDGCYRISLLEVQLVGAPARDCTLNQVVANAHDDMSHDGAKHDFLHGTFESVSR